MLRPFHQAQITFDPIREIGADGRNSKTFLVNDVQLGSDIVIKQIAKAKLTAPDEYFGEARALHASAHQNVVQLHYACEDDDHVYIAMPFYAAGSVKGLMAHRHLTVREIVRLGCQTLSGLHNIHSKGLIHFDIKPDNILLSQRGEALLSDFGLAKQMELGLAQPSQLYMRIAPPEAFAGTPHSLCFDIYQIGITLYRMCVGPAEFERQFSRFLTAAGGLDRPAFAQALEGGDFPDRQAFPAHVPRPLRTVISTCLNVDPASRYRSALAVANALAKIDGCLDWQFMGDPVNRVWRKVSNGAEKRFTVNNDGSTEFVTISASGTQRRDRSLCKPRMTTMEIERVLREN